MPTNARFSYTLRDAQGVEASDCYYASITDAGLVTDAAAEWQALALLLDAITDAKIVHGTVSFPIAMAGGKAAPTADSRVEEVGIFNMSSVGTTRRNGQEVVALADSVRVAGVPSKIDLGNAAVAAFWAALAFGGGIVRFTNAYGQPLITLIDALLSFRKHRAQLERVSFEPAL